MPRRTARRTAAEIFAAAYLDYPLYFDPWRGGVIGFEAACDALEVLRAEHERNRQPAICSGVRLWKRRYVADFLKGADDTPRFRDDAAKAASEAQETGARHVVWGQTAGSETATRVEDGFLRSVGLGAALTPPLSLSFDDLGIYYDPSRPSRLEALIEAAPETAAARARARQLIDRIVDNGVTKYNTGRAAPARPDHPCVILAPGQVEDDASITLGAGKVRTNLALLQSIRRDAPDAWVIYKPHPDVEAGLRPGAISPDDLSGLADDVARDADAHHCLDIANEVWTMTSLMGFEGLIRGKSVTCYGAPFYAGWGLTRDRGAPPDRRRARPSLEALVHAVLIDYPAYRDPVSGLACTPELIVERLSDGVGHAGVAGRALSKAQGLMASYAWIWR